MKGISLIPIAGNVLVTILAIAWAYTSYRYNLLNVGGGAGDTNFWDNARETIPLVSLAAWAMTLVTVFGVGLASRLSSLRLLTSMLLAVALGPAVLLCVHWVLHAAAA